jgi:hypothetical protein
MWSSPGWRRQSPHSHGEEGFLSASSLTHFWRGSNIEHDRVSNVRNIQPSTPRHAHWLRCVAPEHGRESKPATPSLDECPDPFGGASRAGPIHVDPEADQRLPDYDWRPRPAVRRQGSNRGPSDPRAIACGGFRARRAAAGKRDPQHSQRPVPVYLSVRPRFCFWIRKPGFSAPKGKRPVDLVPKPLPPLLPILICFPVDRRRQASHP